jgi:hypothetical protein
MLLLTLPLLLGCAALVIDGANAFAQKRKAQSVADATALAAAKSIVSGTPASACPGGGPTVIDVSTAADCYSQVNDGPFGVDLTPCTEHDPAAPGYRPDPGKGCYAWPYVDKNGDPHDGKVEVRVTRPVGGFFLDAIKIGGIFGKGAFARAVATATPTTEPVCDYDTPGPGPECVIPGPDAVQGTYVPAGEPHCDFSAVDPPVDPPWDQYLGTNPPCTIPATAPIEGQYVQAQDAFCTFNPPVDDPDQYVDTDPPCTIPGTDAVQGTFVPAESAHCVFNPPVDNPDQYLVNNCVIPGKPAVTGTYHDAVQASCTFDPPVDNPNQYLTTNPPCLGPVSGGLDGAMAFVMSPECDAITYRGAGGGTVGALLTNGGIWFEGSTPKRVEVLGYDQSGCPTHPDRPPSGTSACTDPANANDLLCVKQLTDFHDDVPMNWPVPPPPEPSPLPLGTTWDPSIHYASSCVDLGTSDFTFTPGDGSPGIYCLRGGATLTLGGSLSNGDGYTFFALGGGRIAVSSSGTEVKYYWPSSCGTRPTGRPLAFSCFGRTIAGYDPQTLFYATNTTHDAGRCDRNAICINGQNANVIGDMFAVEPGVFPPPERSP